MIQDTFIPSSFEKKTEREALEKKSLEESRLKRKELIKKRREEWLARGKQYHESLLKEESHLI